MGFYDDPDNVKTYMSMAEGYEGQVLIDLLKKHLAEGASLLELGMGPGKDLDMLKEVYHVCGSDNSQVFLDLYRDQHPHADLLLLDAASLMTDRSFDGIYSNKVLHHLDHEGLGASIKEQAARLNDQGIIFHSFWYGDGQEDYDGLRFVYYKEEALKVLFNDLFEVLLVERYTEMDEGDSLYIIGKKRIK